MSAAPEFHSIVSRLPCQVHWGDCDPAGIIFYPTYFRWIDAASWALFEAAGYGPKWMRDQHMAMPLVSAQCEFVAPAAHGDGVVLAKGKETRVWGRYVDGPGTPLKGEPIPEELKARFRAE